tara:strand:+ start:843 stop:2003 length:1161 start_codon:yes stop_codon:yes gene_type:complete
MAETMFGDIYDEATLQNRANNQRAMDIAQLTPGRGSVYLAGLAGGGLMKGIGDLAGVKTNQQVKTEKLNAIMKEAGNLDPTNPEHYITLGNRFIQEGFPDIGTNFLNKSVDQMALVKDKDKEKELTTKESTMEMAAEMHQCAIDAGGWQNSDMACKAKVRKTYVELNRAGADEKGMGEASILNSRAIQTEQTKIYLNSDDSRSSVISIDQSIDMLDSIYSGTAGEGISGFKRLLVGLGLADSNVNASEEGFLRNSMKSVTDWIQKTKGSISDKEMDSFIAASPSLQNTKAGNLLILTTMKNMAQYSIDLETEWNRWKADADRTARATGVPPNEVDWRIHLENWYRTSGKKPKAPSAAEIEAAINDNNVVDDSDVDDFDSEFSYSAS